MAKKIKGRSNGQINCNHNGKQSDFFDCCHRLKDCLQTRRAPPVDGRRFPTEAWMPSRKILVAFQLSACDLAGKAFFFGSFLLTLIKRNEPGRDSGRKPCY